MNRILFKSEELQVPLKYDDPRAIHMGNILNLQQGDSFQAGIIGQSRGTGILEKPLDMGWIWGYTPDTTQEDTLHPIVLILACPRPPVARRVIRDMSTLGIARIEICLSDLNEKSYFSSKLWKNMRWEDALIEGAMQASSYRIPVLRLHGSLKKALADLNPDDELLAFDNAGDAVPLSRVLPGPGSTVLAVGPERGWSDRERKILDSHGFRRTALGTRILRTETACTAACSIILGHQAVLKEIHY